MRNWMQRGARLVRHRWAEGRMNSALPGDLLQRLEQRVAASEQSHSGEIRICVEAGLPFSYIWRDASARERAQTLFGKLRVWDTEHNNGVLIYLLLADHAVEIVVDRALTHAVGADVWQKWVQEMTTNFREGRYENGLNLALSQVSAMLCEHPSATYQRNGVGLPNAPVRVAMDRDD